MKTRMTIPLVAVAAAAGALLNSGGAAATEVPVCDGAVCVSFYKGPGSSEYAAEGYSLTRFHGHIDLTGPGINDTSSDRNGKPTDTDSPAVYGSHGHGSGRLCATGWQPDGRGGYDKVGNPCVDIP